VEEEEVSDVAWDPDEDETEESESYEEKDIDKDDEKPRAKQSARPQCTAMNPNMTDSRARGRTRRNSK
jgi:hypothetical protein